MIYIIISIMFLIAIVIVIYRHKKEIKNLDLQFLMEELKIQTQDIRYYNIDARFCSWNEQKGILLNRRDAELLLKILEKLNPEVLEEILKEYPLLRQVPELYYYDSNSIEYLYLEKNPTFKNKHILMNTKTMECKILNDKEFIKLTNKKNV